MMKLWLNQHSQAIQLVTTRLLAHAWSTLFIFTVFGVALTLPGLMVVSLNHLSGLVSHVKQESKLSVFLETDIADSRISEIENAIQQLPNIRQVVFVSKTQALEDLKVKTEQADLIESLDKNPLPDAFFIEPIQLDEKALRALQQGLEQINGVHDVIVDSAWLQRLHSLLALGENASWLFGGLLCFALVAVISNTIRMQIITHKDEIEVSRLFGATRSFIQRPFLYMGAFYGIGGGLMAFGMIWLIVYLFNQSVRRLAQAYQTDFSLHLQTLEMFITMLGTAALLGWLSALIAVRFSHPRA